ncbi:unnamed protein product, partial [marine sediment metagenome]
RSYLRLHFEVIGEFSNYGQDIEKNKRPYDSGDTLKYQG